ncbi:MAG: hypothetical protein KAX23_06280, partial [Dehalococcoidia bacterium]|nr:hypothetical protein [Dehalococcoidia bacterium]
MQIPPWLDFTLEGIPSREVFALPLEITTYKSLEELFFHPGKTIIMLFVHNVKSVYSSSTLV